MYLFFMTSGFLFVVGFSIVLNYLYEIFSINKFTKFLNPLDDCIFNKISIVIIPNILWSLIEIVILGDNYYFLLGFFLNVFISLCVMYVIKYGYKLIVNRDSNALNIIAILVSCFFGFIINYLCLLIGTNGEIDIIYSIVGVLIFTLFYVLIKFFPPNSEFFRGVNE